SHYLTNYLVSRRPLLWRNKPFAPQRLSSITRSFPRLSWSPGYVPTPYYPVCRSSSQTSPRRDPPDLVARLACLIHAANVHSEPGSNPSIDCITREGENRRHELDSRRKKLDLQRGDRRRMR